MYGFHVTMTILDDERAAFEALMNALAAEVKANEPGNLAYHILRDRSQPTTYRIVEIYASKEAFKQHLSADYVQQANSKVTKILNGPAQAVAVDVLA
jgi:quinol monooxygenase YgiN